MWLRRAQAVKLFQSVKQGLSVFAYRDLNLTKLESRPLPAELQASLGLSAKAAAAASPKIEAILHIIAASES